MIARFGVRGAPAHPVHRSRRSWRGRADLVVVTAAGGLVVAAAVVGQRLLADGANLYLPFPPL
jgi:hypothetical protein